MSTWNQNDVDEFLRRTSSRRMGTGSTEGIDRERDLHEYIIKDCREKMWRFFRGSMCKPTHRTAGEPDFIILADHGRTLLVECKSKSGKLSIEQNAVISDAERLGHTVHVISSFSEWDNISKQGTK